MVILLLGQPSWLKLVYRNLCRAFIKTRRVCQFRQDGQDWPGNLSQEKHEDDDNWTVVTGASWDPQVEQQSLRVSDRPTPTLRSPSSPSPISSLLRRKYWMSRQLLPPVPPLSFPSMHLWTGPPQLERLTSVSVHSSSWSAPDTCKRCHNWTPRFLFQIFILANCFYPTLHSRGSCYVCSVALLAIYSRGGWMNAF